jgi:site-specific DNA-methyltransferase (adenine-specific)
MKQGKGVWMDYKDNQFWLMQGDCLERMKEIPSGSVDMVLCDLPYGTTQNKWDSVIAFEPLWLQYNRVCKGAIVLTAAQPFTSALVMSNPKMFRYQWVWEKSQAVGHLNAWRRPMQQHEDVLVFSLTTPPYFPIITDKPLENQRPVTSRTKRSDNYGNHKLDVHKCPPDKSMPRSIIKFNNAQNTTHPTQKPVPLFEYLIKTYTNEGETVLDNTMGSGTTGVACANLDRKFIGIEMDEGYFNIAKQRILTKETNVINTSK